MDSTTYSNDQIVKVAGNSPSGPRTGGDFRVVGFYPMKDRPTLYRIRSLAGRGERVVPAGELTAASPFRQAAGPSKVVPLFPELLRFERPRA